MSDNSTITDFEFGEEAVVALVGLLPDLLRRNGDCPVCEDAMSLQWTIIHLNDNHEWTREAIADWLDGLPVDLTVRSDA